MNACPSNVELAALVDGELVEARARALRAHAGTCVSCRKAIARFEQLTTDLRESFPAILRADSKAAFADAVLARLDEPRRGARSWPLRVAAISVAATVSLAVGIAWRHAAPSGEWTARGSAANAGSDSPVGRVLVRFGRVTGGQFNVITPGAPIDPHEVLAAEVGRTQHGRFFLLAFIVDAGGERHWIYPAYETGASPPSADPLPATLAEAPRVLSTMTRLDGPAPGPGRIVGIVLTVPETVEYIEGAAVAELSRERLAAHYGTALVVETNVVIGEP